MPVCLHLYHVLLPSKAKTKRYAQCGNQVPHRQSWSQQDVRGGQNHPILMFYYSNSEENVVTDINVEKYFVSIRISDFKDIKEKRLSTCKLQGCPSYKIQVIFFHSFTSLPSFFTDLVCSSMTAKKHDFKV